MATVGLEHEFRVLRDGRLLDFRREVRSLVNGPRVDPADPHAVRISNGGAITADGAEAEVATPPVRLRAGFVRVVGSRARSMEAALRALLPADQRLEGYSTHVSVSLPSAVAVDVAPIYARTFGAALMLISERATSPGLLVRPRPGRLELCVEHVAGARLAATIAFAVGSTLAVARGRYPAPVQVDVVPARERYGWYVDRAAFGCDLVASGRRAALSRARGGPIVAQDHLTQAWATARAALADLAGADDLACADAIVSGDLALASEDDGESAVEVPGAAPTVVSAYALAARSCVRPTFAARPIAATWDLAVFELRGRRVGYAAVPSLALPRVARLLRGGALDDIVDAVLAAPSRGRTLTAGARIGLYDDVVATAALAPREREPDPFAAAPPVPPRAVPWWSVPLAAAAVLAILALALRPGWSM